MKSLLQRLLKYPRKLGISLKLWDFLLILVIVVSGIFLVQFLGRENLDVISSRELLRLTSTPHIRNEAPDAAVRGKAAVLTAPRSWVRKAFNLLASTSFP